MFFWKYKSNKGKYHLVKRLVGGLVLTDCGLLMTADLGWTRTGENLKPKEVCQNCAR